MDNLENYETAEVITKNVFEAIDNNPKNILNT